MIRLTIPSIDESDLRAVSDQIATGMLVQGPRVATFEQAVAEWTGARYAVAVSNGTAALHLALLALGVGRGDAVAVTTYSWPATANVIELCGAKPVFVDIERDTYNMSPAALAKVLAREKVKVVLPIHAFGQMADMAAINTLAKQHGATVVEDAACALGATLAGKQAGTWGDIGCFSFHPRKAITTGEGGMITTNNPQLARTCRILRNHGLDPESATPDFVAPGFNLRITEFQAALGCSQMKKLERIIAARCRGAATYDRLLTGTRLTPPGKLKGAGHVYQSYVAQLPAEVAPRRAELIAMLKTRGVETQIGTYHMPLISYYRKQYRFQPGDFPATDDVAARAFSLPLYETLTESDQQEVVRQVLDATR